MNEKFLLVFWTVALIISLTCLILQVRKRESRGKKIIWDIIFWGGFVVFSVLWIMWALGVF